ncbi:MAG: Wide host range VirA protein [Deltaproteobacteria bacterium ADurb.BinA179]|nr:MAG: Wide host range VirA protein [Deltaproteobacteria bacterium ADurb.BinA179]
MFYVRHISTDQGVFRRIDHQSKGAGQPGSQKGNCMARKLRKTGIDIIRDVPWGTHICQFYRTVEDLTEIVVPYFRAGIENNELCLWVVSEPLAAHDAKKALRSAVPGFDSCMDKGQIEIISYDRWYTRDGRFASRQVLDAWTAKLRHALSAGYDGLRLSGNTLWLEVGEWKDFIAYEKEIEDTIAGKRMIALCTFCIDRCGAADVIDVVSSHQYAIIRRDGGWKVIENASRKTIARELQKREKELRRTNELLSAILNSTHVLIACMDPQADLIMVNRVYAQADGKEPDFFPGRNHFELYPDEESEAAFRKVVATGEPYHACARPFAYNGHPERGVSYWDWSMEPVKDGEGRVKMVVLSLHDVTAQVRARMEVYASEERYRSLFNSMTEGFALHEIVTDESGKPVDYRFLDVNPAFEKLTGLQREEVVGKTMYEVFPGNDPSWVDIYSTVALTGERVQFEKYSESLDHYFEISAYCPEPNRFASIFIDITKRRKVEKELLRHRKQLEELVMARTAELEERNKKLRAEILERRKAEDEKKKIEAQLLQAQKMEALGRFAGGIAHDLNNVLYPVIINTEMLLEDTEPDTSHHELLRQTLFAAHRQRDLIQKILSFSRLSGENFSPIRVSPLFEETIGFLRSSIPSTIEIRSRIDVSADVIIGDPIQIQQVIINLCKNASDAMESQRGSIELSLTNTCLEPAHSRPGMLSGDCLELRVSDTGSGMSREMLERIFDPFFTTKAQGKGSGMGLSIVHGIVKSHRGEITVESEPGRGSTFAVYLPLYSGEAQAVSRHPGKGHSGAGGLREKKRILLIDDEEIVLSSLQRVLNRSGCRVDTAKSGPEALVAFMQNPGGFDLVITDQTMPGMTGLELSQKIREMRPDIPVILCTGYRDVIEERDAASIGIREILVKPTGTRELRSAIRRALSQQARYRARPSPSRRPLHARPGTGER